MTTLYATHPRYLEHTLTGHPEHAGRIQVVWDTIQQAGLTQRLQQVEPEPVEIDIVRTVHSDDYLERLNWLETQSSLVYLDHDTYALPTSYQVALLAAGGVARAVDAVLSGKADNGLAAVRPPGHHALPNRGMGFCLLGNVAIAARYAQRAHAIERVMIVDYDVHHGNGTQNMFYEDDSVLYLSTHQYPFYPGTGAIHDTGTSKGKGFTVNVPLPAGHGDTSFATIFDRIVWPVARRFRPQLILVSAGFDAHFSDPLALMGLSLTGYTHIARELIAMAEALCGGKIVFVMEGGYDLRALGHGMRNVAHALLGEDTISDPFGPLERSEPDVNALVARVCEVHGL